MGKFDKMRKQEKLGFWAKRKHKKVLKSMGDNMDKFYVTLEEGADNYIKAIDFTQNQYGANEEIFQKSTRMVFIRYSLMDIIMLYKMYFQCESENEKNLLARTLAIHLLEFIDDLGAMIGKPMEALLDIFHQEPVLKSKLKELRQIYHSIKEDEDKLRAVRNNVAAHKDRNIRNQIYHMSIVEEIDFDIIVVLKLGLFAIGLQAIERTFVEMAKKYLDEQSKQ